MTAGERFGALVLSLAFFSYPVSSHSQVRVAGPAGDVRDGELNWVADDFLI